MIGLLGSLSPLWMLPGGVPVGSATPDDADERRAHGAKIERLEQRSTDLAERMERLERRLARVLPAPSSGANHLLVVDDDEQVHQLMDDLLTTEGYTVDHANTVSEALRLMAEREYAVVLTDVVMPGLSGLDLLRLAPRKTYQPALVAITGVAMTSDAALLAGWDALVCKPFDLPYLLRTVGVLARQRADLPKGDEGG